MPRGIYDRKTKKVANKTTSTAKHFAAKKANQLLENNKLKDENKELKTQLSLSQKGRDLALDQKASFEQIIKESKDSYGEYVVNITVRDNNDDMIHVSEHHINTEKESLSLVMAHQGVICTSRTKHS